MINKNVKIAKELVNLAKNLTLSASVGGNFRIAASEYVQRRVNGIISWAMKMGYYIRISGDSNVYDLDDARNALYNAAENYKGDGDIHDFFDYNVHFVTEKEKNEIEERRARLQAEEEKINKRINRIIRYAESNNYYIIIDGEAYKPSEAFEPLKSGMAEYSDDVDEFYDVHVHYKDEDETRLFMEKKRKEEEERKRKEEEERKRKMEEERKRKEEEELRRKKEEEQKRIWKKIEEEQKRIWREKQEERRKKEEEEQKQNDLKYGVYSKGERKNFTGMIRTKCADGKVTNATFKIVYDWHEFMGDYLLLIMNDGTWEDGTVITCLWKNGTWKKGTWEDGTWEHGIWEDGTWKKGLWKGDIWKGGVWKGGIWEDGTWTQEEGKQSIWYYGTWKGGTWENGTWVNGTWKGGTWKGGIWKRGIWEGGVDKNGKFHPKGDSPDKWRI